MSYPIDNSGQKKTHTIIYQDFHGFSQLLDGWETLSSSNWLPIL